MQNTYYYTSKIYKQLGYVHEKQRNAKDILLHFQNIQTIRKCLWKVNQCKTHLIILLKYTNYYNVFIKIKSTHMKVL